MLLNAELTKRYAAANFGQSVRRMDLSGQTPAQIHDALVKRHFKPFRVPIASATSLRGERRFLRADGTITDDPEDTTASGEWIYAHADGGLVRVFPHGAPSFGLGLQAPCVRKSVYVQGASLDFGLEGELFAVTGGGAPLPKSVCAGHGLRHEIDAFAVRRLAIEATIAARGHLGEGEAVPLPVTMDLMGLPVARTIAPVERSFESVVDLLDWHLQDYDVVRHERHGSAYFLFLGSPQARFERFGGYRGLASVSIHPGRFTIGVDPIGYAASVDALRLFLRGVLRDLPHRAYDDATGEDVTSVAARFPSLLVSPDRTPPTRDPVP